MVRHRDQYIHEAFAKRLVIWLHQITGKLPVPERGLPKTAKPVPLGVLGRARTSNYVLRITFYASRFTYHSSPIGHARGVP